MLAEEAAQVAGDRVAARYVIEHELGRGGMGVVYRVRDERTGKRVALKRGWSHKRGKLQRRSAALEREYHTLAQLAHPRIIEVYEYGVDERGPYYTMELIEGSDLDQGQPKGWRAQCVLLCDVASSLAILHARGLLHRDLSLRNVRCTPEGRAKLIDFGAMTAIGAARDVVGTPPFTAPEVLQMQDLDARADLFALGALAYYLLTARHAFSARRFRDLPDVWRSPPIPPLQLAPDTPAALSALVMQMLTLDRSARPRSAAEVMERLAHLAGFEPDERIEVSRAYLTTPALVGREKALSYARRQILSLVRGDGGVLLIAGEAGSGRTRMLDACVLEGKLLGVTVIRADARARGEQWALARTLCVRLIDALPNEARAAMWLAPDGLRQMLEESTEGLRSTPLPEHSVMLRALRDFVLQLSRRQRLLLVVDDLELVDEPSRALLASLAHELGPSALLLVCSIQPARGEDGTASLRVLRASAQTLELESLLPDETQRLMRSVFGDVPHVQFVAGTLHEVAQGNPRAIMDLAQHLRERGLARYRAGSWLLPATLAEGELPRNLTDALGSRVRMLSHSAVELLEVLALADEDGIEIADYPRLLVQADHARAFAALEELLAARILIVDDVRSRFSQRGFLPVVRARLTPERAAAIHLRLAELLRTTDGDALRCAEHLLLGARGREAIELLCSVDLQARLPPLPLLERAVTSAEALALPRATIHKLRMGLLSKTSVVLAADSFRRCLPPVLAQLELDSGLACHRELAHVPAPERLQQALKLTLQRRLALAEVERVHEPIDAIRELARVAGALCSFAMQLNDMDAIESLPALEPLLPLSPGLAVLARIVAACKEWLSGRYLAHRHMADACLVQIAAPDRAGLDEVQCTRTWLGLHYALGLFEASTGSERAEQRACMLEAAPEYRVNAWRIRMLMHLSQGNVDEAHKCQRQAELLQLQERAEHRYFGMGSMWELVSLADAGDLVGVKSALESLTEMADQHVGWSASKAYGSCRYRWLQGDLQGALDELMLAFESAPATRHPVFCWLAGTHVRLLFELGRNAEALACGRGYVELFTGEHLVAPDQGLSLGMAQALSVAGEHEHAVRMIDQAIAQSERLGCIGLALGRLYEARARIAIRAGDRSGFERARERCASEYLRACNPTLDARFARLLEDARSHELQGSEPKDVLLMMPSRPSQELRDHPIHRRMLECTGYEDRARCALTLLLQAAECSAGCLFGVRDARPILLAGLPEMPADPGLLRWVEARLRAERGGAEISQESRVGRGEYELPERYTDLDGRSLEAVLLRVREQGRERITAVLALHVPRGRVVIPPRQLLDAVAYELIEHSDVGDIALTDCNTR